MVSMLDNKNIQKKRCIGKIKNLNIKFGDCAVFCVNEGRIELIHITMLKKKLKFFIQKKKSELNLTREKIWYFGRPNFYLQKKSKNSRMGKGKGLIDRKVIRVRRNFIIFEFYGVSKIKIKKMLKYMNKLLSVKLYLKTVDNSTLSLWSKRNKYLIYYNKYIT